MKKVLISSLIIPVLLFLLCVLPEDPAQDPSNASAKFTTINNIDPVNLNEVIAGETVNIGYSLSLPNFIDSIEVSIISSQQDSETTYIVKAPWEGKDLSIPIIFSTAGTKNCVLTCFKSNGATSSTSQIFVVTYQPGNQPPQWNPDTVEFTSPKGLSQSRSLMPYAADPDGNPITFEIILPNAQLTIQESLITAKSSLEAGLYTFGVIISDGVLQDTGIVIWNVFVPQSEHATVQDDSTGTVIDRQVTINVLSNDYIASGTLLLSSVTQPGNGIVAIKNNMAIYIPSSGFTGMDTFSYIVNNLDTGRVIIYVTDGLTTHSPKISVTGDRTLQPQQTCSLFIETSDEDMDQILSVSMKESPEGATIIGDSLFIWRIPVDFIGEKKITLIVADDGVPQLYDSTQVTIVVSTEPVNIAPRWDPETLSINMNDTGKYTIELHTLCQDSDGDKISFLLLSDPLSGDTIRESTYEFIPSAAVIGSHTIKIIASDPHDAKNTLTINLTVTAASMSDNTPPTIKLINPQSDSTFVNAPSATISIEATDERGIATVTASFGTSILAVAETHPVYSVTMTNLAANEYNTVRFIATDASGNGNAETLFVSIKYDPAMNDVTGPVIKQISGPLSGSTITSPTVTITDSITDPSGVDSVYWSLNNGPVKQLTAAIDNATQFSLSETIVRENYDTIIVTAIDKSPQHNQSTQTIILNYLIPPEIFEQSESQTICAGETITFSVTVSGTDPLSYQWRKEILENRTNIPDATAALYEFTTDISDNGTVFSCLVSNGSGTDAVSDPITLTVNSTSTQPTAAAEPTSICSGESTTLSVSSGTLGTDAAWQWYDDKNSSTPLSSLTVSPTANKRYYVKATDGLCSDSPWDSVLVTVNTPSVAPSGISASTATACFGDDVTLTLTGGTLGTNATWQWFTDAACTQPAAGTPSGDASQLTVQPTMNTTYYVQARGGCNNTTPVGNAITVNSPSTAPTSIASNSSSACSGSSITLTVSGGSLGSGATWKWYTNANCTQPASGTLGNNGTQITASPSSNTTYYVRAEGTCGNTPAASKTISVNTPPVVQTLLGGEICEPSEYTSGDYSISATGSSPFSYEWFTTDGTNLGTGSYIYVPAPIAGTTQFYCIVTDVNGCSTRSNTATQTVHQPTVITRQPVGKVVHIEFGERFEDTVSATGDELGYEWQCQQRSGSSWVLMGSSTTISISAYDIPGWDPYDIVENHYFVPVRVKITNQFGCIKYSDTVEAEVWE